MEFTEYCRSVEESFCEMMKDDHHAENFFHLFKYAAIVTLLLAFTFRLWALPVRVGDLGNTFVMLIVLFALITIDIAYVCALWIHARTRVWNPLLQEITQGLFPEFEGRLPTTRHDSRLEGRKTITFVFIDVVLPRRKLSIFHFFVVYFLFFGTMIFAIVAGIVKLVET
jgi:hypothetical protein